MQYENVILLLFKKSKVFLMISPIMSSKIAHRQYVPNKIFEYTVFAII